MSTRRLLTVMGLLSLITAIFSGCGKRTEVEATISGIESETGIISWSSELFATDISSEEEAIKVAEQYGIEFVSFENSVAIFKTEEDVNSVINRGKENGYVELYPNYIRTSNENND